MLYWQHCCLKRHHSVFFCYIVECCAALLACKRHERRLCAGVAQRGHVVGSRERVTLPVNRQVCAVFLTSSYQLKVVVRRDSINLVALPHRRVGGVNTPHKHAVTRQISVPLRLLTVFHQEVFFQSLHGGIDAASLVCSLHGLERICLVFCHHLRFEPPHGITLKAVVAGRCAACVEI